MKESTQVAATVEEAIANALKKLDLTQERVDVEVLQQPKKGFLGIGARDAHVRVIEKEGEAIEQQPAVDPDVQQFVTAETTAIELSVASEEEPVKTVKADDSKAIEEAQQYLQSIVEQMGIEDLRIEVSQKQKQIQFQLFSSKAALLIGKRGQTLNSLQQLAQLVIQKHAERFLMLEMDVENYRQKRRDSLIELANRLADKAVVTGKRVELEPMVSSERKIIHHALADRLDVDTISEGTDNKRYLVIEPVR